MKRLLLRWCVLMLLVCSLCGCNRRETTHSVTLFAASSTGHVLDEISEQFTQTSGIRVRTSYAASSTLAQQIVQGAEADVFISANVQWADYVEENATVDKRRDLLGNRLVVVVPADSSLPVHEPGDLSAQEIQHLAVADVMAVPAGIYAREALTRLGLWEKLKGKVVAGSDVRQTLFYVSSGAAEAGIVYATDAAVTDSVKVAAEIPSEVTPEIRYPVVLLRNNSPMTAADSFFQYLFSSQAAAVFREHGFVVVADR